MADIYSMEVPAVDGRTVSLSSYSGKVLLIVNVASKCGFTPQYEGLEQLYSKYKDQGFMILGFPCNQFGNQEPGTGVEILDFCRLNYGVTFPVFAKIEVNGDNAHPLYVYLKKQRSGFLGSGTIKWNFTKFLIDRSGEVVKRFSPTTKPSQLEKEIKILL